MRMMMKMSLPIQAGNQAVEDGSLGGLIQAFMEDHKPEAAYFFTEQGQRACFFVLDMTDASQIPALAEPFFMKLQARVDFMPVMNAQDLKKGLEAWAGKAMATA